MAILNVGRYQLFNEIKEIHDYYLVIHAEDIRYEEKKLTGLDVININNPSTFKWSGLTFEIGEDTRITKIEFGFKKKGSSGEITAMFEDNNLDIYFEWGGLLEVPAPKLSFE